MLVQGAGLPFEQSKYCTTRGQAEASGGGVLRSACGHGTIAMECGACSARFSAGWLTARVICRGLAVNSDLAAESGCHAHRAPAQNSALGLMAISRRLLLVSRPDLLMLVHGVSRIEAIVGLGGYTHLGRSL